MDRQEFKRQLDELGRVISDGIAYFSDWQSLSVEDKASADALNRYRGFFRPAQNALLNTTLIQFAKVFDRDMRTVSLRNLLGIAKENSGFMVPHATEKELSDIETINNSEELLNRLKCYRDQRLAHHDSTVTGNTRLLFGEMQKLVDDIKSMYNVLTLGHERATYSFDQITRDTNWHTLKVVELMIQDRDEAIQRLKNDENSDSVHC